MLLEIRCFIIICECSGTCNRLIKWGDYRRRETSPASLLLIEKINLILVLHWFSFLSQFKPGEQFKHHPALKETWNLHHKSWFLTLRWLHHSCDKLLRIRMHEEYLLPIADFVSFDSIDLLHVAVALSFHANLSKSSFLLNLTLWKNNNIKIYWVVSFLFVNFRN